MSHQTLQLIQGLILVNKQSVCLLLYSKKHCDVNKHLTAPENIHDFVPSLGYSVYERICQTGECEQVQCVCFSAESN